MRRVKPPHYEEVQAFMDQIESENLCQTTEVDHIKRPLCWRISQLLHIKGSMVRFVGRN